MSPKDSLPKACECLAEHSAGSLMLTQPTERQEGVWVHIRTRSHVEKIR